MNELKKYRLCVAGLDRLMNAVIGTGKNSIKFKTFCIKIKSRNRLL